MSEKNENTRVFEAYRDEINKRQLSNSESFDKAMLSLSSAGLALSLTFIKFIVPLDQIEYTFFLYSTWWLFGTTIILTILSLQISQIALQSTLRFADEYYLQNNKDSFNKKDIYIKITDWFNKIPTLTFILAIFSVIIFTTQNLQINKEENMSKDNKNASNVEYGLEAADIPVMQKVPNGDTITNGAEIPKMQPKQASEKSTTDNKEK